MSAQRPKDDPVHQQRQQEHDPEAEEDPDRDRPAVLRGEREGVRTRHYELAVCEVDEAQDAEHEADSDGHQGVNRAEPAGIRKRLPVDAEDGQCHARYAPTSAPVSFADSGPSVRRS